MGIDSSLIGARHLFESVLDSMVVTSPGGEQIPLSEGYFHIEGEDGHTEAPVISVNAEDQALPQLMYEAECFASGFFGLRLWDVCYRLTSQQIIACGIRVSEVSEQDPEDVLATYTQVQLADSSSPALTEGLKLLIAAEAISKVFSFSVTPSGLLAHPREVDFFSADRGQMQLYQSALALGRHPAEIQDLEPLLRYPAPSLVRMHACNSYMRDLAPRMQSILEQQPDTRLGIEQTS